MKRREKFILLFILSYTSVYFAEVISGSFKYPLFDIWGYLGVIPIYGLHTILLLYIITRKTKEGIIPFRILYFAGILFGLYEAYLTKVLWTGLSEDAFILGNIAILDFIVLVFFWHPIMSFIVPVLVFELLVVKEQSVYSGLPEKIKRLLLSKKSLFVLIFLVGMIQALNSGEIIVAVSSSLGAGIPLVLFYYLLYRKNYQKKYTWIEILPTKRESIICAVLLLLYYVGMGLVLKPEELTVANQVTIFIYYVIFGFIFYFSIRNYKIQTEFHSKTMNVSHLLKIVLFISIIGGSTSLLWLLGLREIFMVVFWISWILIGILLLITQMISRN